MYCLRSITLGVVLSFAGTACVTGEHYNKAISQYATPTATPSPDPAKKKPPEEPPKQFEIECKITNNEGRIFTARSDSKEAAEGKARRACQINYRHCTYLSCDLVQVQP